MKFLILLAVVLCSSIYSFGQNPDYQPTDRWCWGATIFKKIRKDLSIKVEPKEGYYALITIKGSNPKCFKVSNDTIFTVNTGADRIKILHKKEDRSRGILADYVDNSQKNLLSPRSGTIKSPATGSINVSTTVTSL